MKAKQVTALMMAATLAVTSNGVTAFAEPVANVETGDAVTEALDVESTENVETTEEAEMVDALNVETTEEVEETEDVTKSVQQAATDVTITLSESGSAVKAGEQASVEAKVTGTNIDNGTYTVKRYELVKTAGGDTKTIDTNTTGLFAFVPEKDATYKIKVVFSHATQQYEYFKEENINSGSAYTITAAEVSFKKLHAPKVTTLTNNTVQKLKIDSSTMPTEVKAALDAANAQDKAYGTWSVEDDADLAASGKVSFKFSPTAAMYKAIEEKISDVTTVAGDDSTGGSYTVESKITVVQLATAVAITDEKTATVGELGTGEKMKLTAEVTGTTNADTSNAKLTWTSSDPSKVTVTSTGDKEAVITAVAPTDGKAVVITAATTDGSKLTGNYQVTVINGVSADSVKFDDKLPEITYKGDGDLESYYKEYVDTLNKNTTVGTYSIASNAKDEKYVNIVGGTASSAKISALKTNTEDSQTIKNALTLVFTLDKKKAKAVDGKKVWTADSSDSVVFKTYDVVINRAVVDKSATEVTGELKSSYVAGTTFDNILSGKNATDFTIEVQQKQKDGTWKTVEDTSKGLNVGTLAGYQIKYSLKSNKLYTLRGVDADGFKYLSLSGITITQPELTDVKVEVDNTSKGLTADGKIVAGATHQVVLKASYNKEKLGSKYTPSYQWYKLDESTGEYKTASNGTSEKLTLDASSSVDDVVGTYYCEVTATGDVKQIIDGATDEQQTQFGKIVRSSNKITVATTQISFTEGKIKVGTVEAVNNVAEAVYGDTKKVTANATIKAKDVSSYRVYYKTVTSVAGKEVEGAAKEITKKTVNDSEAYLFNKTGGRTITESVGTLDAGTQRIYLEVTAGKETTNYLIGDVKVAQKEILGLDSKKLKVEDVTYGQKLSDAKIVYNDTEIDAALDFAFVDNTVADAGSYTSKDVAVSVVDKNYTTDTKTTLKADVNVAKAPLSVTAKDVTIEQGQEAALDGTVKGLIGKDTVKVTYAVLGADGKAVQSTKNLAVGTYKIRATVEDQKNYDVTSVVDGTLTVNAVAATGVTVNTTALKINVGESRQVSATVAPANAADKSVTWSSNNTAVAKVTSDGVVYAIAEGTANVTAKTANGKTATIAVTVSTVKADSVKLSASKVTLKSIGATKTVKATVNPTNTTDKTVTWKSSNKKVATVSKSGKITAKGNGTATITATTANGKKATVKVTVKQTTKKVVLKVSDKTVTGKTYTLKKGKKVTVKATVTDAKGKKVTSGNQKITWTTSNKKVATISKSGKITAKKAGTVTITAKTADGKKVTFKVKVK